MKTARIHVFDERRGRFARVRHKRVLIYWPHGLGDWAHLSTILPFFEPSNQYAITRYGDDYVSVMEGNGYATPIYTGLRSISDGADAGARHLGIDFKRINGGTRTIHIPRLEEAFHRNDFDAVLYTDYPEREGRTKFPFHTKARALLRDLVHLEPTQLEQLERPLASTLSFEMQPALQERVDERLRCFVEPGERLMLLCESGHTAARKNWDVHEALRLRELAAAQPPAWKVLAFDGQFSTLFGGLDAPFALVLKALLHRTDLVVGIPAGPLHVALAYAQIPVVGIWLAHHPDWYEERCENAVHLLGAGVFDRGYDRRPATSSTPPSLRSRTLEFRSQAQPRADDVWQAALELLR